VRDVHNPETGSPDMLFCIFLTGMLIMIRKKGLELKRGKRKNWPHLLSEWKNIPDISKSKRILTMTEFKMNIEK